MSELFVGHVRVTTSLYEAQLLAIRGGGPVNALDDLLSSLVRVQIDIVERMRDACQGQLRQSPKNRPECYALLLVPLPSSSRYVDAG
jgi:hypothetical protein